MQNITEFFIKKTLIFFYIVAGIFFLTSAFSENLFRFPYTDEMQASSYYIDYGFFQCTGVYYFFSTINRLSSGSTVCFFGLFANLFESYYFGVLAFRLISIIALTFSLSFLIAR